jgi:polysaccharide biosynthesis/export protein
MTIHVQPAFIAAILCILSPACCRAGETRADANSTGLEQNSYRLGPEDAVVVNVLQAPEIGEGKPLRIDLNGQLSFPYIGRVAAAGKTVAQLQEELTARFKIVLKDPQLTVTVAEFNSQPVSILGAVNAPGVHQIRGRKLLAEMVSVAGGLRQDAGSSIVITRRHDEGPIPLPSATEDPSGNFYTATVGLQDLVLAKHPEQNIAIEPYDVISIPVTEMVYVLGEVAKPGAFPLGERSDLSLTQALALAGGINHIADASHSRVLHKLRGHMGARVEKIINVKRVLQGKERDFQLQAEDIVFVPGSTAKAASIKAIEAAIQVGTGMAIWSTPR